MTYTKQSIIHITLSLGAFALGLFIILDLIGSDEKPVPSTPDLPLDSNLVGTIPNTWTDSLTGTFSDGGNLYITFAEGSSVYLTYFNNVTKKWLDTPISLNLHTDYGVDAVTLQNPDVKTETIVCIFTKNGNADNGNVEYNCSAIQEGPKPTFEFQSPTIFNQLGRSIEGLVSVTQAPLDRQQFDLSFNEYFWNNGGYNEYRIKHIECKITPNDDPNDYLNLLNNICRPIAGTIVAGTKSIEPSIVGIPSMKNPVKKIFYTFYAQPEDNDKIVYRSLSATDPSTLSIALANHQYEYRRTKTRTSPYFLENISGGHIFLAYKNNNDTGIGFSKISLENWNKPETDPNYKMWTHCSINVHSNVGPTLFEHNEKLYLLYADAHNGNILTYRRIDDQC